MGIKMNRKINYKILHFKKNIQGVFLQRKDATTVSKSLK